MLRRICSLVERSSDPDNYHADASLVRSTRVPNKLTKNTIRNGCLALISCSIGWVLTGHMVYTIVTECGACNVTYIGC
jgi:hypothetical protein